MAGGCEKIIADLESKLVPAAEEVFSGDLFSVVLYGSAARGTYRRGISDVNVLIVLEKSSPDRIFLFGKKAKRLIRRHRITPLIMSREEFAGSADVFPMEYGDIRDAHRLLRGTEIDFPVPTRTNLRHQIEERLRGAVNDLRQMLIAAGGRERPLGFYLKSWSGAPNALFRGLARLKKPESPPADPEELLALTAREYGVDTSAFTELNSFRTGKKKPASGLAEALLASLKALAAAVDAMPSGGDAG